MVFLSGTFEKYRFPSYIYNFFANSLIGSVFNIFIGVNSFYNPKVRFKHATILCVCMYVYMCIYPRRIQHCGLSKHSFVLKINVTN
jgi:hypothetical protein